MPRLSFQKISGDVEICEASGDVGAAKAALSEQLGPALCQRWILPDASQDDILFMRAAIRKRMSDLLNSLERHAYQETMAIRNAPKPMEKLLGAVLELTAHNPRRERFRQSDWEYTRMIVSGDAAELRKALQAFPQHVDEGLVKPKAVATVKRWLQQMRDEKVPTLPELVKVYSMLTAVFCGWLLLALKYWDLVAESGQLELEDSMDLEWRGDSELHLLLLLDVHPLWAMIESRREAQRVSGLQGFAMMSDKLAIEEKRQLLPVGLKLLPQSLKALVKLMGPEQTLQQELLDATTSQKMREGQLHQSSLLQVLLHMFPEGGSPLVGRLCSIMETGDEEARENAYVRFTRFYPTAEPHKVAEDLLKAMLAEEAIENDEQLIQALAFAAERDTSVKDLLHAQLKNAEQSWMQCRVARVARLAAAIGPSPEVLEAILTSLELGLVKREHLLQTTESLVKMSPEHKPQAFDALRRELNQRRGERCQDLFYGMVACLPVDGVHAMLTNYLRRARHFLDSEGAQGVRAAALLARHLPEHSALLSMAHAALARCLASGDVGCQEPLLELGALKRDAWELLCPGLRDPRPQVVRACAVVVRRRGDETTVEVLLRMAKEEQVAITQCLLAELMGELAHGQEDVVAYLLGLAQSHDPVARSGALKALGALGAHEAVPVLREHLQERDEEVRLASLQSLVMLEEPGKLEELCLRSLADDSSKVLLLALRTAVALASEEFLVAVPLMQHGDALVREACYHLLGQLGHSALEAMQMPTDWVEKDPRVLQAREEALRQLSS